MKIKIVITLMIAALTATLLGGCCACRKGKNNLPLVGTEWQLKRLMGRDYTFDKGIFTFTFNDKGEVAGKGACNRFFGSYTTSKTGALTISGIGSTRMACPDMATETAFIELLERATHYEIDGNMLLILCNGEMQAIMQAAQ